MLLQLYIYILYEVDLLLLYLANACPKNPLALGWIKVFERPCFMPHLKGGP